MVEQDFAELVTKLCAYFERKQPSPETLGRWFEELRHIPKETLTWIKKQFCEQARFPTNFPAAVKGFWNEWLFAFPEKRAKEKKPGCSICHNGWIFVSYWADEVGYWGETALKCAHCNRNGDPKVIQAWTLEQVIISGKFFRAQVGGPHEYVQHLPEIPGERPGGPASNPAGTPGRDLDGLVHQVAGGMAA